MLMDLIIAALSAIQDYVATHVLTCLIPAFMLAGGRIRRSLRPRRERCPDTVPKTMRRLPPVIGSPVRRQSRVPGEAGRCGRSKYGV